MSATHAEPSLDGMRVLLVEDSYLVAATLRKMLQDLGCEVVGPAASVDQALELVDRRGCDAAILDVNLGAETAEPVARRLDELGRPFVFVTGYASPPLSSSIFQRTRRLHKPIDISILRRTMVNEFTG